MMMQNTAWHETTNVSFLIILTALAILHLATIVLPPVNLEFAFADAVRYFRTGNVNLLDQYFHYQANTLAFSFAGYLLGNLLPFSDPLIALRLLSTFGLFLLGLSIRRIALFFGADLGAGFFLVLLLNPLIWTYAGRATADLFPAAVAIYALSLTLQKDTSWISDLVAGVMFGLAGVLKYHVLGLGAVLFFMSCSVLGLRAAIRKTAVVMLLGLSIVAVFLTFNYLIFGFLLTPEHYQKIHRLSLRNYLGNLIGYSGFLILLSIPFIFFVPKAKTLLSENWKTVLLAAVAAFSFGFVFVENSGELNLGPLDRWVAPPVSSGLLSLFVLSGIVTLFLQFRGDPILKIRKILLLSGLFAVLVVFSATRPAQRYLIAFLPFFLMLLPPAAFRKKQIILPTIAVLVIANAFIAYSQWCTGVAAQRMTELLIQSGRMATTDPGAIEAHVGDLFRGVDVEKADFKVVSGRVSEAVLVSESPFPFARRAYSLVPVSSAAAR